MTRVGRIIRRTALDELPEVLNIFKREMSLVGPRALGLAEQQALEKIIPGFEKRLQVPPGLTGLAQIYNQSDDAHEKFRYDLSYLYRMSPWLDAKLLVVSVWNTVGARWDQRRGKPVAPGVNSSGSEETRHQSEAPDRWCGKNNES